MTTKPPTWTDPHPDTRSDAIAWHRDSRDVSGEQKLDLIAAVSPEAYDRAHAALDAILGPLMVPYEIGGPCGRAAQDQLLRAWIGFGEAVKRFAVQWPTCIHCKRPNRDGGRWCNACESVRRETDMPAPTLGRLVGEDVVEMTEAEFRQAIADRFPGSDIERLANMWMVDCRNDSFTFIVSVTHPHLNGRRVRIVPQRSWAGRWGVWLPWHNGGAWATENGRDVAFYDRADTERYAKHWWSMSPHDVRPYPIGAEAP